MTGDYARLSHRYYALKAKWLGLEKLRALGPQRAAAGRRRPRDPVGRGARPGAVGLWRLLARSWPSIGQRFFDKPWIDAALRPGKSGGAFAHPTVPSAHPYLLVNYHGSTRDVMTLAHELGHGVHQVLAGGQGYLMSGTPLTLAETASVFGEMLTFRALLDAETRPGQAPASCWPPRSRTC